MEDSSLTIRNYSENPVTVNELLDAGLHFGHQSRRWNPKMSNFIFDKRNGIHIIDLNKTRYLLEKAAEYAKQVGERGRNMLLVGTKKQAQDIIKAAAEASGQPYVSHRWMGGMLTNADTIRQRVRRLKELNELEKNGTIDSMHKKEASQVRHELEKLRRNLTGIADMTKEPGVMFVIDSSREAIAIQEANRLKIPIIAMLDTNADPDWVDYPIPGNDDAIRAIELVTNRIVNAFMEGRRIYEEAEAERLRKQAEEERRIEEARAKAAEEAKKAKEAAKAKAAEAAQKAKEEKADAPTATEEASDPTEAAPAAEPEADSEAEAKTAE